MATGDGNHRASDVSTGAALKHSRCDRAKKMAGTESGKSSADRVKPPEKKGQAALVHQAFSETFSSPTQVSSSGTIQRGRANPALCPFDDAIPFLKINKMC